MKQIFAIVFFLNSLTLFSQNIEVVGGLNKNTFFNFKQDKGHFTSSYYSDLGYCVGIGVDDIKIDWLTVRFTLGLEKYGGNIEASDGGINLGYTTVARVDKSILSVGIFPINFKILERIDFNFGLAFS